MMVIFEQIFIAKRDFTDQKVFFLLSTVFGKNQLCFEEIKYFHFQNRLS
jgi:hypothetical protein